MYETGFLTNNDNLQNKRRNKIFEIRKTISTTNYYNVGIFLLQKYLLQVRRVAHLEVPIFTVKQ